MKLKEYLDKYGIPPYRFAEMVDISAVTIYKVVKGIKCRYSTAMKIENFTKSRNGQCYVSLRDIRGQPEAPKKKKK